MPETSATNFTIAMTMPRSRSYQPSIPVIGFGWVVIVSILLHQSQHGFAWQLPPVTLPSRLKRRIGTTRITTQLLNSPDGDTTPRYSRRELWTSAIHIGTALTLVSSIPPTYASYIDPVTSPITITDKVYLDIEFVNNSNVKKNGRIVFGLYGQAMPKTVQNFVALCRSNAYAGTNFYRIISEYSIQGGAIGDLSKSGKSGQSSFEDGTSFEPDNFNIKHTTKGLVSMVKAQPTNGGGGGVDSRFFIQLQDDAGWADDRYAAFGIVLEGMDTVDAVKDVAVQPPKNNPKQEVNIVGSGVL